jgi:Dirigent-like protein
MRRRYRDIPLGRIRRAAESTFAREADRTSAERPMCGAPAAPSVGCITTDSEVHVSHRLLVAAALLGAALLAVTHVGRASSAAQTTYTVRFDKKTLVHALDAKPKGVSAGDITVFSADVLAGTRPAGRLEGTTVAIDNRYQGVSFSFVVYLPGGMLTLAGGGLNGHVPGLPAHLPDDLAVTGGTGEYAGARGVATLKNLGPTTQRLTLSLRP